jgi:hypothetical protein
LTWELRKHPQIQDNLKKEMPVVFVLLPFGAEAMG